MPEIHSIGPEFDIDELPEDDIVKYYYNLLSDKGLLETRDYITVSGMPFYLNMNWKNIGINLSGGADSAILFYIIAKIISDLKLDIVLHPICVVRYWKKAFHVDQAKQNVYNYVKTKFVDVDIKNIQWGFIPEAYELTPIENLNFPDSEKDSYNDKFGLANSDIYFFKEFNNWVTSKNKLDIILSGTTLNPVLENLEESPSFRDRKYLKTENIFWPKFNKNIENPAHTFTFDPFMFVEKSWTTAQYTNFGLEDLFEMTKSCEHDENGCGKCFHCKERQWSIDNQYRYIGKQNVRKNLGFIT